MIAQAADVGSKRRRGTRLATAPTDHRDELIDALPWLVLAASDRLKGDALVLGKLLAHRRGQKGAPRRPTVARQGIAKKLRIGQRLAQGDLRPHSAASMCSR